MKHLRFVSTSAFLAFGIVFLATSSFAQSRELNDALGQRFVDFKLAKVTRSSNSLVLLSGRDRFEIALAEHDVRSTRFQSMVTGATGMRPLERAEVSTFKGVTKAGGKSRVNLISGRFEGYFVHDGETKFFEPASKFSQAADDEYVIYSSDDLVDQGTFGCGASVVEKTEQFKSGNDQLSAVMGGTKLIELAVDADLEYVNTLGGVNAANEEILGIINTIEGIYEGDLGLTIRVVFQHAWTIPDPYAGANPEFTTRNFQAYWNANAPFNTVARDTAHLFSAKANIQGQGWAFIGVVCNNPSFSYGVSGYISWAPGKHLITSHELAHNLGANHADAPQACSGSVMNAQLSGSTPLTFCTFSRNEIVNHVVTNSCITEQNSCKFDFDGDAKADLAIFRPSAGEWWTSRSSNGTSWAAQFGTSADKIVPADFTGDGKADVALFRPANGFWFVLRSEDQTYYAFPFGSNGDTPVPDDFDADGKADAAIFRPSTGVWYISKSSGGTDIYQFGVTGDVPVNSDYDGDGRSDVAIFRPSVGQWWLQRTTAGSGVWQFGSSTDRTVPGDYTGDGKSDIAIFRPTTGEWSVMRSEDQSFYSFPFGSIGDIPASGDYDGDGKFDAAVFRPSSSVWFAQRSTAGTLIQQFGANGDLPLASAFVR